MENQEAQQANDRVRYRLDAQSLGVIDAEIAKLNANGPTVALTRRQMLRLLVARAACCRCDAEKRELPELARSTGELKRRWFINGDAFVRAVVQSEAQKIADDERWKVWLSPHQLLRMLLMRAARCRCETQSQSA